jgi:hypothetical protein
MLNAEFEVCGECGNLHMEGVAGPDDVDECAVCGGYVTDVEVEDLDIEIDELDVNLDDLIGL